MILVETKNTKMEISTLSSYQSLLVQKLTLFYDAYCVDGTDGALWIVQVMRLWKVICFKDDTRKKRARQKTKTN